MLRQVKLTPVAVAIKFHNYQLTMQSTTRSKISSTEHIRLSTPQGDMGRGETEGVSLPSQQERTPQLGS
jgi:hypothetical protein